MAYNKKQINSHIVASQALDKIIREVFSYIKNHKTCSEYEVQQYILSRFDHYQLETDKDRTPIVAFRKSASNIHYFPPKNGSLKLKSESLIMIDIWARTKEKNSVFSDITWMAYYGKNVPIEVKKIYDLVVEARDAAIRYVKNSLNKGELPKGRETDLAARDIIARDGHAHRFLHTTGHSLGLDHPHGKFVGINTKNRRKLKVNVPYTIEPGVYIKNKFGARSEMNFYIDSQMEMKFTTKIQKKLVLLT